MKNQFVNLNTLSSITPAQLLTLRHLGIISLADLLSFAPIRQARAIQAWRDGLLNKSEVSVYLKPSAHNKSAETLLREPPDVLACTTHQITEELTHLDLKTVEDVANYAAFAEAEQLISCASPTDDTQTDPSGPHCVIPTCRQFTRNTKRYVSFFRQKELRNLSINLGTQPNIRGESILPLAHLFDYRANEPRTIYLGYSIVYQQNWIYTGIHLGEPRGGVSMLMGQDTQVSVLDFQRITKANQQEKNSATEQLTNILIHQRAVDEVARATAEEHQHGATSGFGANAATAGSFTAAGAVLGGVGGGISGAIAGLVLGNVANLAGGLPTIGGAFAGAALGSAAGAAAGSLVASGATTLGFVDTDADGDREIFARSAQNIQQRTVQNSSSIRSFWSSIVSQSLQSEEQSIRTDRITNHNRIHALNALYFEVLANYRITVEATDFDALIFIPFKPLHFTTSTLEQFWWILRNGLNDKVLINNLDQHFLTLNTDLSNDAQARDLPDLIDVKSSKITVKLNIDGSAIKDAIKTAIAATLGITDGLPGVVMNILSSLVQGFIEGIKRDNVSISLITSSSGVNNEIPLSRYASPNRDANFIGTFTTSRSVPLTTIKEIHIRNNNPNQKLNFLLGEIDFGEIHFEDVRAQVSIANKASIRPHIPNISTLETTTILSEKLTVGSHSTKPVAWPIADQLADAFQGVNEEAETLEDNNDLIAAQIRNLLSFLNANCFTFTRLIMQTTEREQIAAILENLEINGEPLSRIAGTTPIGFTSNQVILPLKKRDGFSKSYDRTNWDTTTLRALLESINEDGLRSPKTISNQLTRLSDACSTFLDDTKGSNAPNTPFEAALQTQIVELHQLATRLQTALKHPREFILAQSQTRELFELIVSIIHRLRRPAQGSSGKMNTLIGFSENLKQDLTPRMGQIISSDEVALPTPAVFMEPVLSHSKGAELYDMRRNSHYNLLEAPSIAATDPNTLRGQSITLSPTVPNAVLQQQEPPQFPLPSNLSAALSEAGLLNLDTLLSTNAASLQNIVSTLATLSAELAKASTTLTGDSQRQVLQAATDVSKQIGSLVENGQTQAAQLARSAQQPPVTPQQTPPSAAPTPPATQQEKSGVLREQERIDKSNATPIQKAERKATIGAPTRTPTFLDYRFVISFFDQFGALFPDGNVVCELSFESLVKPGTTDSVALNGGHPTPFNTASGLTIDSVSLETGKLVQLTIDTDINGNNIKSPAPIDIRLPTNREVLIHVKLDFIKEKFTTTNLITTLRERSLSTRFGLAASAVFEDILNGSTKFPLFRVFEIEAGGSSKQELDLKAEFERTQTNNDSDSQSTNTVKEYEILTPVSWKVAINPV